MSASDWVANTTATFFLRSVLSHSRIRAAKIGESRNSQASSRMSKRRAAVEPLFQPVEQVEQGRRRRFRPRHDLFHLEQDDVGEVQPVFGAVEHAAHGAVLRVGQERRLNRRVLDEQAKAGEMALLRRGGPQAAQRRPDRLLDIRRVGEAFLRENVSSPSCQGIGPPLRRVDACERLECGDTVAAEIDGGSAHAEQGRARRAALVEHEDLRAGKPLPLQGEEGEQHGLARAGRANNHGVTDIADMEVQPERRRAIGARDGQRRCIEMPVPRVASPGRRERRHMREVERRHHRVADIGPGVPGDARQPGFDGVETFRDGDEARARR